MDATRRKEILGKIQKCLAMAEDGRGNANEAATALRMAQALMRQHGLSETDVVAAQAEERRAKAATWTQVKPWEHRLARLVSETFGVQLYWAQGSSTAQRLGDWVYYGDPMRAELAVYAHAVLQRHITKARTRFVAELPSYMRRGEKASEAETFIDGFLTTVRASCAPLVPSKKEQTALDAYAASKHLVTRGRGQKFGGGSGGSRDAGVQAGKGVTLHRPMGGAGEVRQLT
jgi:hypothetical protein